jgi:hypothetical protein
MLISVEGSIDGSAPWFPLTRADGTAISKTITANGDYSLGVAEAFGRFVRLKYVLTGTTPSFTLTSKLISKD